MSYMMPSDHEKKIRQAHIWREVIEVILLVVVITVAIRLSIQSSNVIGSSMEPGLSSTQDFMVNKLAYVFGAPQRGDVIIFYFPYDTTQSFVKRIIGLPGDTIQIDPQKVTVNGKVLTEPYISTPYNTNVGTVTLGPDQFWVMGDHREVSCDSRSWGMLDRKYIIGKAIFVYWPFSSLHSINTYSNTFASVPNIKPTKSSTTYTTVYNCKA